MVLFCHSFLAEKLTKYMSKHAISKDLVLFPSPVWWLAINGVLSGEGPDNSWTTPDFIILESLSLSLFKETHLHRIFWISIRNQMEQEGYWIICLITWQVLQKEVSGDFLTHLFVSFSKEYYLIYLFLSSLIVSTEQPPPRSWIMLQEPDRTRPTGNID